MRELGLHLRTLMEALQVHHSACQKVIEDFQANFVNELDKPTPPTRPGFSTADVEFDDQVEPLISTD